MEKVFKKDKNIKYIGCNHSDVEITNKRDLEKIVKKYKPNIIVNTVALIGINFCEENPKKNYGCKCLFSL